MQFANCQSVRKSYHWNFLRNIQNYDIAFIKIRWSCETNIFQSLVKKIKITTETIKTKLNEVETAKQLSSLQEMSSKDIFDNYFEMINHSKKARK